MLSVNFRPFEKQKSVRNSDSRVPQLTHRYPHVECLESMRKVIVGKKENGGEEDPFGLLDLDWRPQTHA